jgi:tetratricopeptide (TPR) repeat protein
VLGDAPKAGAMEERAALRALALGRPDAAARFRLRGGGFLFQAGRYLDADAMLTNVIGDTKAGAMRAKASMLRGLARGRALAAGLPGITPAAYAQALEEQVRDYPDDPATDEARWLLGTLARASGDTARALASWSAIPHGSPRWLEAQLALAEIKRAALESHLVTGDHHVLTEEYQRAQRELSEIMKIARGETEIIELSLALVRLGLVPTVGHPQPAVALAQRIQRMNATPLERYRARLLYTIAQCQAGRYVEAEREAQNHVSWAEPGARETFLDAVRLLDQSAASSEMDLPQRRFGMVLRLLIQPELRDAEADADNERWTADQRAELQMRLARALLFLGDDRGAQMALRGWPGPPRSAGDALLRDLADTYNRLEAYELAIDVERLRAKSLTTGSPSWFDARYGLALAYFHAGRQKEAAQLIDATTILHPELGGGTLQKKFIRLRQRLGARS